MAVKRKHAILSASGAHRWMNCTPSARLEEPIPDTSSVYAEEGALAHSLAELELKKGLKQIKAADYKKKLKEIGAHELYSGEMAEHAKAYADYVLEQLAEAKATGGDPIIFLEQQLNFSKWVPEGFGTSDCIIISSDMLEIIDYKYGKGVEVEAEDNSQMMLYALGALEEYGFLYDITRVRMTVFQPRIGNISSFEVPVNELLIWAEKELKPKAETAWKGEGDPVPGDWCRFCKVKARCKARAEAMQAVPNEFEYKDPNLLTQDEIAEILHKVDEIVAWARDVQDYALVQARDHGVRFPGWKLVEGRSNRRYTDEEQVVAALIAADYTEDQIYKPREVLGVSAMEKLLGRKKFRELLGDYIEKPPGKPTLVPESDKRPELNSAEADFEFITA